MQSEDGKDFRRERRRIQIWCRLLALAATLTFAFTLGLWSVSPNGQVGLGSVGSPSHDIHHYVWFFQNFSVLSAMLMMGIEVGILALFISLPVAIIVSLIAGVVPPFANLVCTANIRLFLLGALVLGGFAGLSITLTIGVYPGLCC